MADEDVKKLESISRQLLEAIRKRDRNRLSMLLHPEFVQVDESGVRLDRNAFLSSIVSGDFTIENLSFDWLTTEVLGDAAVVCGIQRAEVTFPDGERIEGCTAFTDAFVRDGDGWLLRVATSVETDVEVAEED